ncbi:MAG: DMT family transporter [Bacillota bacterium]|nr:DMT family transporter [Bacillota bacterium]
MLKGYIYSTLSAVLFGSAGIVVKLAYAEGLDPINLLILQYIIAVFIMFVVLVCADRAALKIRPMDLFHTAVLGIIGNTFMTVFYYLAFSYLDVPLVAILLYTYPIMVFIYMFVFERKAAGKGKLIALLTAFTGCFFSLGLTSGVGRLSLLGIGFGLLSAVFFSFMNIYSEKKLRNVNPLCINFYSTAFSLISLIIYEPPHFIIGAGINTRLIGLTTVLAVFCEIVPLTLLYAAIKYIGSLKVSIIGNLEIPTAMILSFVLLGESLTSIQVIGAAMVIYSVYRIESKTI